MAGSGGMTEASLTQLVYDLLAIESAAREAQINQEALYRQQGDESNQQLINLETQQRITAVSNIQTSTSQSITRMDGNISQLQTLVNQVVLNVNTFQAMVMAQEANIDILTGDETTVGSVAKALFDAKAYTDLRISEVLDNAPALLDTLKELADALGGDANFVTNINNAITAEASTRQQQVIDLQTAIAALGGSVGNELNEAIADLEATISTEASARAAADTSLSTMISTEASSRASADSSLSSRVSTETSTRTSADNSLSSRLSLEESTRASADTSLTTRLSTEESIRAAAEALTLSAANAYSDSKKQEILNLLSQTLIKKQNITLTPQHIFQGYIDLPHINIISGSLSAFLDRLAIFENEDFALSQVGAATRLTFANSLASSGSEALEGGETLRITYWTL